MLGVYRGEAGAGFFCSSLDFGRKSGHSADAMTFFLSSLNFGRKTDVTIFKEPVLYLRSENISGPAGMALNFAPFQIPGHALVG